MARGFAVYSEIDSMNVTSPPYRVAHTSPNEFDKFLAKTHKQYLGDAAAACDAIRQRQAIMSMDIPGEYGETLEQSAKRVHAKMLVFVSPEDHMVNPDPAVDFANAIGAPVVLLQSNCGHSSLVVHPDRHNGGDIPRRSSLGAVNHAARKRQEIEPMGRVVGLPS